MLVLDTPHSNWKNALKAHQPIHVGPDRRDDTVYHLTALSKKVTPPPTTRRTEGSDRGLAYREQRDVALKGPRRPEGSSYQQQLKKAGLAPAWAKTAASKQQGGVHAAVAKSEISSAAKALWQQYIALLSGRAVGPLPASVINAVASYSSSKEAVAA